MNNKLDVTEDKIEITDINLHKHLFELLYVSGKLSKPEGLDSKDFEWIGGISAHCYVKWDFTKTQITDVQIVTVPFTSKLPETIASKMWERMKKDMMAAYGRKA